MSVVLPADAGAFWWPAERTCHYCHGPVEPPAVSWQLADPVLLHRECATRLGCHLIADSREAELAAGDGPWRRRAARAAGAALAAREARV